jgi:lipopolysaccharide export system protein LptA
MMRRTIATAALAASLCAAASAQEQGSPFGGFKHDSSQPIEITADSLEVRQADQQAIFSGSVVAGQGTLRLTADRLNVWYAETDGDGDIDRLRAEGDVFMTSGAEAARGAWAEYSVSTGVVTMGGGVVLTQGPNAIRGERLTIDLNAGQGRIEGGRVQSIFQPSPARAP